jgi:hypothetical protein
LVSTVHSDLKCFALRIGNFNKIIVPQILGINHWFVVPLLVGGGLSLFFWFEKKGM